LDSHLTTFNPTGPEGGVACLLGKTRPPARATERADADIFNIKNDYTSYAYTLSPKTVGIMANKSRDKQYETLKRLHNETLSQFQCSYIINIELYNDDSSNLHAHGLIRFRTHNDKVKFEKLLKEKITMGRKGTYKRLIDCEFVNDFNAWADYIFKDQQRILSFNYLPFVKIDHSFHQTLDDHVMIVQPVAPALKTRLKAKIKTLSKIQKLEFQLEILKKSLEIL